MNSLKQQVFLKKSANICNDCYSWKITAVIRQIAASVNLWLHAHILSPYIVNFGTD